MKGIKSFIEMPSILQELLLVWFQSVPLRGRHQLGIEKGKHRLDEFFPLILAPPRVHFHSFAGKDGKLQRTSNCLFVEGATRLQDFELWLFYLDLYGCAVFNQNRELFVTDPSDDLPIMIHPNLVAQQRS